MIPVLPRREREIFEILCGLDEATAAEVRERMANAPGYSAVRTMLARLEAKGLIRHREQDGAYAYAIVPRESDVRESALKQMVKTFFDGSAASAATALLGLTRGLAPDEVESLQQAIDRARKNQAAEQQA
ncbi:BlaI/MecI/CopY family transcriptional regulator [Sandaracinobacter sp. RS1-74]|uniref:BlaI/MecI/CopY family transcriptional regulator n=1 Tax=Sandaracinobacteroides sayramensis TaxID=2913411 RepID=UPI001ED9D39E|nr:BlaI/MecI/CopY family transcriptional regulator [Sandaracinobacteroides sayramensis]MCG2840521.1 BlaI/MecI/CopY family transcriptional regulator [Sandaracinobacteroides sayramensis]